MTKYLRGNANPNVRLQDGVKAPLLCRDCEQRFAVWEREFATQVFHPIIEGRVADVAYGDWMLRFCASVSWRTLIYLCDTVVQGDWADPEVGRQCEAAEGAWRAYLLGETANPGPYRQHLLSVGLIDAHLPGLPDRFNSFMQRSTVINLCHFPGTVFTVTKMSGFIVLGFITGREKDWRSQSRVGARSGTVTLNGFWAPTYFWQYLFEEARTANEKGEAMSDRQRSKLETAFLADPEKAINSHQFKLYRADLATQGREVESEPKA